MTPSSSLPTPLVPTPAAEQWATAAVFFVNGFGFASWASRVPAVRDGLQLTEGQLGMALLAMGVGALCAFQLTGRGLAHLSARGLTLATGFLCCCALPQPAMVGSLPMLAFCLLLMGAAVGAMDVAMNALAVEVEVRRGRPIMSGLHGLWSAGGLCGAAVGSVMAQQGVSPDVHLGIAGVSMAAGLLAARPWLPALPPKATLNKSPRGRAPRFGMGCKAQTTAIAEAMARICNAADRPKRGCAPREGLVQRCPKPPESKPAFALPERALWGLGGIVFCSFLIEGAMADWSAIHLKDSLGTSAAVAALGYSAFSLAMMGMRLAGNQLVARWPAAGLLRVANAAAALVLVAALVVGHVALTMLAFVLVGLGVAVVAPLVFSAGARRSQHGAGHGIAAMATLGYSGFLLGPPLIGWLAHLSSLRLALGVLAMLAAGIALLAHHLSEPAQA